MKKKALKFALEGFEGEVFVFGSRLDPQKQGGDIDILLKPKVSSEGYSLKTGVVSRFQRVLEQDLDVVVYHENNVFSQEVLKYAQRLDLTCL